MLNNFWIITVCLLAAASSVQAVPAAPHFHELQQPDGSKIIARQWGDEHSHGWETDTEHAIVFDTAIKGWTYAVHDKRGKLTTSSVLSRKGVAPPAGIQKKLRTRQAVSFINTAGTPTSAAVASTTTPRSAAPITGSKSLPVILIGFSDAPFSKTKSDFDNLLFGSIGNSLKNYYLENSYRQFTVNGGPSGVFGPLSANSTHNYYGAPSGAQSDSYVGNLVYEAVSKASSAGLQFADYVDQSKSCNVDTVVIIHQGTGQESGFNSTDIWSHSWDLYSAYGSEFVTDESCSFPGGGGFIRVNNYTIQPELAVPSGTIIGSGVFAHEYGHALGIPDLYDTDGSSEGAGYWSLMASGLWLGKTVGYGHSTYSTGDSPAHLDPWSKYNLGWIDPVRIGGVRQNMPLEAASSAVPDFYLLGNGSPGSGEYFLVENRQKSGFDTYLKGSGLLIWHIDGTTVSNLLDGNTINDHECTSAVAGACADPAAHYGVALVQADNALDLEQYSNPGDITDPFLAPKSFSDSTAPNSRFWSGAASGWSVSSISASTASMRATLAGPPIAPDVSTCSAISTASGATLTGTVNDNNAATSVTFDYGLTTDYGSNIAGGTITAGSGPTAVSAAITGLSCNSSYHFRISGTNSVGTGTGADSSFSTPACPPGIPVITSATAGSSQASIYISPPDSNGGAPITSYTVTPSSGNGVTGDILPIIVTGLVNGSSYTFTARAQNAAGYGESSAPSATVIPGTVRNSGMVTGTTGYQTLQSAFDADIHTAEVRIFAGALVGPFDKDSPETVFVTGGFDAAFTFTSGGAPSVLGAVRLKSGTTRFQKIVIRP